MSIKKYDAVVIGSGNGGLSASVKLQQSGLKTLLVEKHNLPGGFATSFVRGRFEFEPSLHELCGIDSMNGKAPLKEMFKDLGIEDRIEWVKLKEAYRMITLDGKYDVTMHLGRAAYINDLLKVCPGQRECAEKFFDILVSISKTMDYVSGIEKFTPKTLTDFLKSHMTFLNTANYSVDSVLNSLKMPKEMQDIIDAYWCYLGMPTDELNFLHYATMLDSYLLNGAVIPKYRSHEISTAFTDRFEELGGELWFNTAATKINVKDNKVTGVELSNGDTIEAETVICNASPYTAYTKLIDSENIPLFQKKELNTRKLGCRGFAVYLGLDKSADELGLDNHSYFIFNSADSRKEYERAKKKATNNMQATVCLNRAIPDCSPEGTCILYMTSLFTDDDWSDVTPDNYVNVKERFASKMIDNFEKATKCKIRDSIEEIEIAAPMTYAHYTGAPDGVIYGFEANKNDNIVKRIAFDFLKPGIENLYFAGGYSSQHMGYQPAFNTGCTAAVNAVNKLKGGE